MKANILQNEKGDYNVVGFTCEGNKVDWELVCKGVEMASSTFNYLIHAVLSEKNKILADVVAKNNADNDMEQSEDNDILAEIGMILLEADWKSRNEVSVNQ